MAGCWHEKSDARWPSELFEARLAWEVARREFDRDDDLSLMLLETTTRTYRLCLSNNRAAAENIDFSEFAEAIGRLAAKDGRLDVTKALSEPAELKRAMHRIAAERIESEGFDPEQAWADTVLELDLWISAMEHKH